MAPAKSGENMPRKSRDLRLTQTRILIEAYEAAGLGEDRNCRFALDMERRILQNKGLSPKRRAWLDSIIEEGVPLPKGNPELLARITAATATKGMTEFDTGVLTDFAGKIRRGWDLSPKQTAWMDKLIAKADDITLNGLWVPDAALEAKMAIAYLIGKGKDNWYWQHRPGTAKAYNKISAWLADRENNQIDEWACNKLLDAYKKVFAELDMPRHDIGDMRYFRNNVGIIAGAPYVNDSGKLVYPVLVTGMLIDAPAEAIMKRRSTKR
jgi:hypothetical protein